MTIKDTLEGDNMYTCSQCGKKVRAEKRWEVTRVLAKTSAVCFHTCPRCGRCGSKVWMNIAAVLSELDATFCRLFSADRIVLLCSNRLVVSPLPEPVSRSCRGS